MMTTWTVAVALPCALAWLAVWWWSPASLWWLALFLWWVRPLHGRVVILHLAHAAFGEHLSTREALRGLPRLWLRHLPWALVGLRFLPGRTTSGPVFQLEGLSGRASLARARALRAVDGDSLFLWTATCIVCEAVWLLTMPALTELVAPGAALEWAEGMLSSDPTASSLPVLFLGFGWILAYSMVEPFHVGGGFGVYLNRRVILEGWDVELGLRRLASRRRARVERASFVLLGCLLAVGSGHADEPLASRSPAGNSDIAEIAAEVLADPEFGGTETRRSLALGDGVEAGGNLDLSAVAGVVRVVILAGLGLLVVAFLVALARHVPAGLAGARRAAADLAPAAPLPPDESTALPADIGAAARARLQADDPTGCLSLLYRGSIERFVESGAVVLRPGSTEGDCLRAVTDAVPGAPAELFRDLTTRWSRTAYAGRAPERAALEALCARWAALFATSSVGS